MTLAETALEDILNEHVFYLQRIAKFVAIVSAIHAVFLVSVGESGVIFLNSVLTTVIMAVTWFLFLKRRVAAAEILMAFGSIALVAVASYRSPFFANPSPMLLIIALQVPLIISTARARWGFFSIITACVLFVVLSTPEFREPVELPLPSLTATLMNSAIAAGVVMFIAISGVHGVRRYSALRRKHREQEAQLIHSAKLASLGEMAAGMAHEINNPLAIIDASAWKLRLRISKKMDLDPEDVLRTATLINDSAQRMTDIIKGMRNFSRDGSQDPLERVTTRKIIEDAIIMCKARLKLTETNLTISESKLFDVTVETMPVHLTQVLVNLIQNAADAVYSLHAEDSRWIKISCQQPEADYLDIKITDSGLGIPDHIAIKIFEPFFTTKEAGKGTGLGLSVSKNIMDKLGGELKLITDGGHTCFVIRVPVAKRQNDASEYNTARI